MHAAVAPETLRPNRARTKMTEPVKKITAKMTEPVKKTTAKMTEPATGVQAPPWAACSRALAVGLAPRDFRGPPPRRLDSLGPLCARLFARALLRGPRPHPPGRPWAARWLPGAGWPGCINTVRYIQICNRNMSDRWADQN